METRTLVTALREFRLAQDRGSLSPDTVLEVPEFGRVHRLDMRTTLLLAAEALERRDVHYVPKYRELVRRMQAENYDLLYERLMGEPIPKELQAS